MKLWQGERWFLQVDSHSRFADGWDTTLLRSAAETGSDKPILSGYPPAFTPGENEVLRGDPLQMFFQQFTSDGILQLRSGAFPEGRTSKKPLRARFLAAGFLFAPGQFVREVPYDPDLYFMGEESAMTVRAFTHGYDLFHPADAIVWHYYGRADARKHWGDHADEGNARVTWKKLDEGSRNKVRLLLSGEEVEQFGLGTARTLSDYEAYAGLSFRHRVAQRYTLRGGEPPNPDCGADWTSGIYPWIAKIRFKSDEVPEGALSDPMSWNLSVLDEEGFEICQKNVNAEELAPLAGAAGELVIICEFSSETIPASWTLWPLMRSGQWLPRFGGRFSEGDFAILADGE